MPNGKSGKTNANEKKKTTKKQQKATNNQISKGDHLTKKNSPK